MAAITAADAFERRLLEGTPITILALGTPSIIKMLLNCGVNCQARVGERAGQFFLAPAQVGLAQRIVVGRPGRVAEQCRLMIGNSSRAGHIVGCRVDIIELSNGLGQLVVCNSTTGKSALASLEAGS